MENTVEEEYVKIQESPMVDIYISRRLLESGPIGELVPQRDYRYIIKFERILDLYLMSYGIVFLGYVGEKSIIHFGSDPSNQQWFEQAMDQLAEFRKTNPPLRRLSKVYLNPMVIAFIPDEQGAIKSIKDLMNVPPHTVFDFQFQHIKRFYLDPEMGVVVEGYHGSQWCLKLEDPHENANFLELIKTQRHDFFQTLERNQTPLPKTVEVRVNSMVSLFLPESMLNEGALPSNFKIPPGILSLYHFDEIKEFYRSGDDGIVLDGYDGSSYRLQLDQPGEIDLVFAQLENLKNEHEQKKDFLN